MDELPEFSDLQARIEQNRLNFLNADLAICFTFADLVKTELAFGDREAAEQAFGKAEDGYATIAQFLPDVQNESQRNEIEEKLTLLRTTLDNVRLHFPPRTR